MAGFANDAKKMLELFGRQRKHCVIYSLCNKNEIRT